MVFELDSYNCHNWLNCLILHIYLTHAQLVTSYCIFNLSTIIIIN